MFIKLHQEAQRPGFHKIFLLIPATFTGRYALTGDEVSLGEWTGFHVVHIITRHATETFLPVAAVVLQPVLQLIEMITRHLLVPQNLHAAPEVCSWTVFIFGSRTHTVIFVVSVGIARRQRNTAVE